MFDIEVLYHGRSMYPKRDRAREPGPQLVCN
ncbi:MAG: hypothetical protein JWQ87_5262 [Candidatus Sulfotelmatobacter sp.]|nr:hypothetical protein [Candidatus Sulfotelmatobacter sp.]